MSEAPTLPSGTSRTPRLYWEDFTEGMTMEFGPKKVERDEVIRFATEFDPQPFHIDEEAGKASLFKGLAASGWHTASMVMRLMCDGYILNSSSLGSPGLEGLKWLKPVLVGDEIRARMRVLGSRPMKSKPHVGLVHNVWEALNQRDEVVMTLESWAMFGRRHPAVADAASS